MQTDQYAELKADIAERGVMVPIEFDEDGNILDGYHRKKICDELGITDYPKVIRAGMTEEEKLTHARKLNMARRHLNQEQKRELIREQIKATPEKSDRQIANDLGVSNATVSSQRHDMEDAGELFKLNSSIGADGKERPRQVQRKLVSVYNPSNRDAEALKDPDIQRRLAENDKMNVAGAIREQTRDNLIEHLESVETKEAKAVQGVYDVIVIDPPWPLQKIERDARPKQAGLEYPTMTLDEIKALKIPAAENCHIFLWTTQKFLHEAFHVMEAWNVKPIWTFVWVKNNGVKPYGLPTSTIEFVLYGHIGAPQFTNEKDFRSHIEANATGHSIKPDAFYDMVREHTAGRRLDMFNRRKIDGFDTWGKEAAE